jgi:hypothetical protein
MREESWPGDLVLIEAGKGVGIVKYRLPRPGINNQEQVIRRRESDRPRRFVLDEQALIGRREWRTAFDTLWLGARTSLRGTPEIVRDRRRHVPNHAAESSLAAI